jgi:hypothetical protein
VARLLKGIKPKMDRLKLLKERCVQEADRSKCAPPALLDQMTGVACFRSVWDVRGVLRNCAVCFNVDATPSARPCLFSLHLPVERAGLRLKVANLITETVAHRMQV